MDPLHAISVKIEEIKAEVRTAVQIALLREATLFNLSRLATLDPSNASQYTSAIEALK